MDKGKSETEIEESRQLLFDKISVYKMIQQKKCENEKSTTSDARMQGLRETKTLFDNTSQQMNLWLDPLKLGGYLSEKMKRVQ